MPLLSGPKPTSGGAVGLPANENAEVRQGAPASKWDLLYAAVLLSRELQQLFVNDQPVSVHIVGLV